MTHSTTTGAANAPTPATDRPFAGEEVMSLEEALEEGLEFAPSDWRSDIDLQIAASEGREDYHG